MTIVLTWLHLLAAVTWIGGMLFLSLVLVPIVNQESFAGQRAMLVRAVARRFQVLVWLAVAVLLLTGPLLLMHHGFSLLHPSAWSSVLIVKVLLVGILLGSTALHQRVLGPLVSRLREMPAEARTSRDRRLMVWSTQIPRVSLAVALLIVFMGLLLART